MKNFNFMLVLSLILGLVIGLSHASPIEASPIEDGDMMSLNGTSLATTSSTLGWDPSFEWWPFSMVQVWIGKTRSTVGNIRDGELYHAVYEQLEKICPDNSGDNDGGHCSTDEKVKGVGFWTRCPKPNGAIGPCYTKMRSFGGSWTNPETRRLLIGVAAATVEALANNPDNCYGQEGERFCNIGDAVRVHFPTITDYRWKGNFKSTHLYFMIENTEAHGDWNCCASRSRKFVHEAVLDYGPEIEKQYPQYKDNKFSLSTRCIINKWEECANPDLV